jgi:hypothetical protein
LQNSVSFAEALAVFRPRAYKTAFFSGCSFKTEVLKEPQYKGLDLPFCFDLAAEIRKKRKK